MKIENNKITADNGMVLRRKSDGMIFGHEVYPGYLYYLQGERLPEPLLELPEHYEEVNEALMDETLLLDENKPMIEEMSQIDSANADVVHQPRKVTVGDYMKLEEELRQIKKVLGLI